MRKTILVLILIAASILFLFYNPTRPTQDNEENIDLSQYEVATFAGGCFWCMEASFEAEEGVIESISGFSGGHVENPTYNEVISKTTGHLEAVQVYYDPETITYGELLDVFWRNIDPTDTGGQFVDRGEQYLTAIFYHDLEQKQLAEESRQALVDSMRFSDPIVTEIRELETFYEAEEYHQDYYQKKVLNYKIYSSNSGREEFKEENWGE